MIKKPSPIFTKEFAFVPLFIVLAAFFFFNRSQLDTNDVQAAGAREIWSPGVNSVNYSHDTITSASNIRAVDTSELRDDIQAKAAALGMTASMDWTGGGSHTAWTSSDVATGNTIRGYYIQDLRDNLKKFYSPFSTGRPTAPVFTDDPIVTTGANPTPAKAIHITELRSSFASSQGCGDGLLQTSAGEQCDRSNLNGQTCVSISPYSGQTFTGGTLACNCGTSSCTPSNCTFNTASCIPCTAVPGGWSSWSSCNCSTGTQTQTCDNPPPACGGAVCAGCSGAGCALSPETNTRSCSCCNFNGICEVSNFENGTVCGSDCCDSGTPCATTNIGTGEICRSINGGSYGWTTQANVDSYCDQTSEVCVSTAACPGTTYRCKNIGVWTTSGGNCRCKDGICSLSTVPETCSSCSDDCGACAFYYYCASPSACTSGSYGSLAQCQSANPGKTCYGTSAGCTNTMGNNAPAGCAVCGNSIVEGAEQCDTANLNGQTCVSKGFNLGGTLTCNANCTFNTSNCSGCSLSTSAPGFPTCYSEAPGSIPINPCPSLNIGTFGPCPGLPVVPLPPCDVAHANQVTSGTLCGGACMYRCSTGVTSSTGTLGAPVNYTCTCTNVCGNGVKEGTEQCDTGASRGSCPATCSLACTNNSCPICGNGIVEGAEQCDTGGSRGSCPATCSLACTNNSCPVCSWVFLAGNMSCGAVGCVPPTDPCTSVNDGELQNPFAGPPCSVSGASCQYQCSCGAYCGNGIVEGTEQCDTGASRGSCPATCSLTCTNNTCPITCSAQSYTTANGCGNVTLPGGTPASTPYSTSCPGGCTGTVSATCNAAGAWTSQSNNCVVVSCVGECCGQSDGTLCGYTGCGPNCIGLPNTCNVHSNERDTYNQYSGRCYGESCVSCTIYSAGPPPFNGCAPGNVNYICDFSAKCNTSYYCGELFNPCGAQCGNGLPSCTSPNECYGPPDCQCGCLAEGQGCGIFSSTNGHYNCCSGLTCSNGFAGVCETCTGWQFQHCGSPCPNAGDCWGTYHCAKNTCSVSGTQYDCAADAGCFAANCTSVPNALCNMVNDECCSHNCVHTGGPTEPQAWDGHCGGLASVACSAATNGSCSVPGASSGSSPAGTCSEGGSCSASCNNGTWTWTNNCKPWCACNHVACCGGCGAYGCPANKWGYADMLAPYGICVNGVPPGCVCNTTNCNGSIGAYVCDSNPTPACLCSATTINNCDLPSGVSGNTAGSCASGYGGSCSYNCGFSATWYLNSNSCVSCNGTGQSWVNDCNTGETTNISTTPCPGACTGWHTECTGGCIDTCTVQCN